MTAVQIYLIDDNLRYRMDLKNKINKYIKENYLVIKYDVIPIQNYTDFYKKLSAVPIKNSDIFIIDIQLNTYFDGIDFGEKIRKNNQECQIVYLTAYNKAIDIINHQIYPNAYITKSNDMEVMQIQLMDLFNSLNINTINPNKTIMVSSNNVQFILHLSDILYVSILKGFRNRLIIQTLHMNLIIDSSLSKLKKELPSPPFYLDFKSIIVNLSNIKSISPIDDTIIFKNSSSLNLSSKLIYKLIKFQKGLK